MKTTDISQELKDGIAAYYRRIDAIGGFGVAISARFPDGAVRTGILGEASPCQPTLTQDDGRRFVITDIASIRRTQEGR